MRNLLNFHVAFSAVEEPESYKQATVGANADDWKKAKQEEYDALIKNDTWELVERPSDVKIVDNRWVYKVKPETDSSQMKFRARLVARGFTQEYGINYFETFSPVVRFTSIRMIYQLLHRRKWQ